MWKLMPALLLCLTIGMTSCATTGTPQEKAQLLSSTSAAQAQIDEARQQFAEAYQRGDAAALSELFAPDGAFTGTISPVWREGRGAIRENWTRVFDRFPKSEIRFQDPVIRFYNTSPEGAITENTVAIETGLFEMRMVDTTGQSSRTPGKYSLIRVWRNGRWEIVNYHTSPIPGQR
jgi:uncharacterized protein (TIGR02246 family)